MSINEWRNLPPSLFIHAWVVTGYTTKEEMLKCHQMTEESLEEVGHVIPNAKHETIPSSCTYIYIYTTKDEDNYGGT